MSDTLNEGVVRRPGKDRKDIQKGPVTAEAESDNSYRPRNVKNGGQPPAPGRGM